MSISFREFFAMAHGMVFGALFLLAFSGGLVGLYTLRYDWLGPIGLRVRARQLSAGTWLMAVVAWLTVLTGTYIVYPWYRAVAPQGTTGAALEQYPQRFLQAYPNLAEWHSFAMEWKEHIAWMAPILATAVAFVVVVYGGRLADRPHVRRSLIVLFTLAFAAAAIAGVFGALITKAAPVQ
jgi:hypothetical protein